MIIRSQDKLKITTDLNLEIYDCHDDRFEIVNQTVDMLGIYSTQEKAFKVLDMICEAYSRIEDVANHIVQATKEDSYVFQMPLDEEVEV